MRTRIRNNMTKYGQKPTWIKMFLDALKMLKPEQNGHHFAEDICKLMHEILQMENYLCIDSDFNYVYLKGSN